MDRLRDRYVAHIDFVSTLFIRIASYLLRKRNATITEQVCHSFIMRNHKHGDILFYTGQKMELISSRITGSRLVNCFIRINIPAPLVALAIFSLLQLPSGKLFGQSFLPIDPAESHHVNCLFRCICGVIAWVCLCRLRFKALFMLTPNSSMGLKWSRDLAAQPKITPYCGASVF